MHFRNPTKAEFEALQALAAAGELCWLDSAGELADSFDNMALELAELDAAGKVAAARYAHDVLIECNVMASELYRQALNQALKLVAA
jgi:hypothetical protein